MESLLLCVEIIAFIVAVSKADSSANVRLGENAEKRLLDHITRGYDRNVRPVFNASHPIIIELGITLTQIFDMDEKNQVLTTNVWLDQEWTDEMLIWDPEEFDGLKEIRIPCEKIWLPDIVLYNNADDYTSGYMQSKAMVHSDGTVFWPPPTKFRSTCAVDVTYFPFDDQTCSMKLGSWTYNGYEVDVTNRSQDVDLSNYIDSGEWELLLATVHRNVVYYSCCPEPFPDVTISLTIRRKTLFYVYNIVLPCMMMSSLTLLVFCMPPESGEKIALGVTVLLAFSVFMLAIAEKMPETSDNIPLIGIYLTTVMAITCVSIIMTVVVLNLHYHDTANAGDMGRMPSWIKRLLNNRGQTVRYRSCSRHCMLHRPERRSMRFHSSLRRCTRGSRTTKSKQCETKTRLQPLFPRRRYEKDETIHMTAMEQPTVTIERAIGMNDGLENLGASCSDVTIRHSNSAEQCTAPNCMARSVCCQCQTLPVDGDNGHWPRPSLVSHSHNCSQCRERGVSNCYMSRMTLSTSPDANAEDQDLEGYSTMVSGGHISDWRRLAITCDRILFWVFLVVTVATSLLFIVILPLYKRSHLPSRMSHLNMT